MILLLFFSSGTPIISIVFLFVCCCFLFCFVLITTIVCDILFECCAGFGKSKRGSACIFLQELIITVFRYCPLYEFGVIVIVARMLTEAPILAACYNVVC